MTYILKGQHEETRLDEQTSLPEYSLNNELRDFHFNAGEIILDAGCGSGVLCRHLEEQKTNLYVSGCDLSVESLEYAKGKSKKTTTNYFKHDLVHESLENQYHVIFNRLVAHHLNFIDYQSVLGNFYSGLKPGGRVCVIDTDGLFLNLGTHSPSLINKIQKVKDTFSGNLLIARSIPGLLHQAGFINIKWRIDLMDFQGESRLQEANQWKERFSHSLPFYVEIFGNEFEAHSFFREKERFSHSLPFYLEIFGNEFEAHSFFREYISEVLRPEIPLFYNKFIITAVKRGI